MKSKDEVTEDNHVPFNNAIDFLMKNNNDAEEAKLMKTIRI